MYFQNYQVTKRSQINAYKIPLQGEYFWTEFPCQWPINRWRCFDEDLNSTSSRLPYCLLKGPLKRDFLDIYLTTFSESVISEKKKLLRSSFFSKNLFFSDNIIWIGTVKLSLLKVGYISSATNVLTSSPKIWHVNNRDFLEHNFLASVQWII